MDKHIFILQKYVLSKEKSTQKRYSVQGKRDLELQQDLLQLIRAKSFPTAIICATELLGRTKDITEQQKLTLAIARLYVVCGDKSSAETFYHEFLKQTIGPGFIFQTEYSFVIDVFLQAPSLPPVYIGILEEYVENVLGTEKKYSLNRLFYQLIVIHHTGQDPWDPTSNLDLSLLPKHIREIYLARTTTLLNNPAYLCDLKTIAQNLGNEYSSKYGLNYFQLYRRTKGNQRTNFKSTN
ncbi:hypothetical protein NEHOM01_1673 [Nematocida homosporus]|uniref:uncharacterized protein n=1 Tax=Nematocida homosporus TaxID=1912981 RepID=UPI00221E7A94|nr:uncharacterized protein NEHOM01_1673 [Nematocida homosporus]KAI5186742.1 hypothetical protein NEHOM01_1673 [Nematocida homosporus]